MLRLYLLKKIVIMGVIDSRIMRETVSKCSYSLCLTVLPFLLF